MNIPNYSKLFIQIALETSVRESDCPGNVRYPLTRPQVTRIVKFVIHTVRRYVRSSYAPWRHEYRRMLCALVSCTFK